MDYYKKYLNKKYPKVSKYNQSIEIALFTLAFVLMYTGAFLLAV